MIPTLRTLGARLGLQEPLVTPQEHLQLELLATHAEAVEEDQRKRQSIRQELEAFDAQGGPRLQKAWFDAWRGLREPVAHANDWRPGRCA